jgi:hypothetical protein
MMNVGFWQCAPKARIISGGRIHTELSIDPVADERLVRVTGFRPPDRDVLFG